MTLTGQNTTSRALGDGEREYRGIYEALKYWVSKSKPLCVYLVRVLCALFSASEAGLETEDQAHPLRLSIRSSLAGLHGLTGKHQRVQAKFRKCHHP